MIPVEGLFISQYKMLEALDLLNTVVGLTLVYVAGVLPFTIWTLRGFVAGVPDELEEAAMIDGCSRTQAFFRITFPLLAPGLVATGVFGFIQAWNEFTLALVVMTREDQLHPAGLADDVHRGQPRHRLGRDHGRLDADRHPGRRVLPARPGPDGLGPDLRGGEGMTSRSSGLALRVQLACVRRARRSRRTSYADAARRGPRRGLPLRQQHRRRPGGRRRADARRSRAANPRAVIAVDEEGGDVTRLHALDGSPVARPGRARRRRRPRRSPATTGAPIGAELAAVGVDLDLGPVADVNSNPDNPVIGTRSFGTDPHLVAATTSPPG